MKFFLQPDYSNRQVQIYSLQSGASAQLVTTVSLASSSAGPNDVVVYEDGGSSKMFVSYDLGDSGLIEIYDFTPILAAAVAGEASMSPATLASINIGSSVVGMAIQPGTGNLYAATFNDGSALQTTPGLTGRGGVILLTAASGYNPGFGIQFSDDGDDSVTTYCANLAFDEAGNLWMTTWDAGTADSSVVSGQYLVCYLAAGGTLSKKPFFKVGNITPAGATVTFSSTRMPSRVVALPPSSSAPPGTLIPFSAPEGIAFDPDGNLWLANNNDFVNPNGDNNGTLVRIDAAWIAQNMLNYTSMNEAVLAGAAGIQLNFENDDPLVTIFYLYGAKFGGLVFDGYTLYAHDQENSEGATGALTDNVVWKFDTTVLPPTEASFSKTAILTDYPGNGGSVIVNAQPAQLFIRENNADTGAEPDPSVFPWECPDIAVNMTALALKAPNQPIDDSMVLASASIENGSPAYIVVRISNRPGAPSSTGAEVLKLYWAKASAGLGWPAPWDGLAFDTTASNPPLGGFLGAKPVGVIDPGNESFFQFLWSNPPDSAKFSVNDEHFCLLARIETTSVYPFSFDSPEQTNLSGTAGPLSDNVIANRGIGWRNITILASVPPAPSGPSRISPYRLGVLGANYSAAAPIRFSVQAVGADGKALATPPKMTVQISSHLRDRLLAAEFWAEALRHIIDDLFHIHDPIQGIGKILLHRNETLPLRFEVTLPEDVQDFAIRVVQYAEEHGESKVVGGQTFVVGNVRGFPIHER